MASRSGSSAITAEPPFCELSICPPDLANDCTLKMQVQP